MFVSRHQQVEPGAVDWFQLSWPTKGEAYYGKAFYEKQRELERAGYPIRPDRRSQYYGGTAAGVFVGSCSQGGFVEARGAVANDIFQGAKRLGGGRCSRIDLQTTILVGCRDEGIASACGSAVLARAAVGDNKAPQICPIIGQEGKGWTQYLGSPASDKRTRVYDKGAQKGLMEAGWLWRFEIQYRRRYAQEVYGQLCRVDSCERFITAAVCGQFDAWGVDLAVAGIEPSQVVFGRREPTDDEKTLSWLCAQVAPSISRLLTSSSRGEARRLIYGWAAEAGLLDGELERW